MRHIIERIHKRTTEYSHPSQATTTANALELLSSGIYTEEERFVFELLQNAVDSYNPDISSGLDVKIVVKNNNLMFLHNGQPFSERDLEGLCDIGNGNKMSDAQKIGYKGIGFKSVFMHSKCVTVVTEGTAFKFDEEACKILAHNKGDEYQDVKMPWQIIPIPIDKPSLTEYGTYNVATVLAVNNGAKLLGKVKRLLSDARFLLFLNIGNLKMTLWDEDKEVLSLSKNQDGDLLTLSKNGEPQNKWLMYSKSINLTPNVKADLVYDTKTPDKLKKSDAVEISFAVALDKDNRIIPLKDAVVYTYLPTSFSFGFSFIVNANFITDAGRQQLIKDCEWNKFIFSQIPSLYLNWIKDTIAPKYEDWHMVLPSIVGGVNDLELSYKSALAKSVDSIPFVRTIDGSQIYLKDAIVEEVNVSQGLPLKIYNKWVKGLFNSNVNKSTLISKEAGVSLSDFGVNVLNRNSLISLLKDGTNYISSLSTDEWVNFLEWLSSLDSNQFGEYAIVPDENSNAMPPLMLFFPSAYKDENSIAKDARTVNSKLCELISEKCKGWLALLGVKEMDNLSVIENVLCSEGYITKENSLDIVRFIFDSDHKSQIIDKLPKTKIKNIRLLTNSGFLVKADDAFLDKTYGTSLQIPIKDDENVFISSDYLRPSDSALDWQIFFRKLGANTEFEISKRTFGKDTQLYRDLSSYVDYCSGHEKNYGYRIHTSGYFVHRYISAQLPPRMDLWSKYEWSKLIWGSLFTKPISLKRNDDHIAGHTGFGHYAYGYLTDNTEGHRYLGKYLIQYLTESRCILPGTDGSLHKASDLLAPTEENLRLVGCYYPMLFSKGSIDSSWLSYLNLKKNLSLTDYLDVLDRISGDDSKEKIAENKERICRIYERISDGGFDFSEGSYNFNLLRNWGRVHKLLSRELNFVEPTKLCLLSSRISGVNIENQIFYPWLKNDRFAAMMIAFGVNMISDHRVEGLDEASEMPEVRKKIENKIDFLTVISTSERFSVDSWNESRLKMVEAVEKLNFFKTISIRVVYGTQAIDKPIYVKDNNLYYVGKFGAGVQELLTSDIVRLLGLHKGHQTTFLTILRMSDFEELKDYLSQKGYDTSFLIKPELPQIIEPSPGGAILGGEEPPYGGLSKEQMKVALVEAKDAILAKMSCEGYDTSSAQWDGWTCVDGIRKDGKEYPLVIRSNKGGRNTILSGIDWNQLMKPNAMFVVNTSNGIGTINFKQLLKSKENITIRFGSENLDYESRISRLAAAFSFFKGMQFDFESYVTPVISRWQSFMASEKNTGERLEAIDPSFLPE